MRDVVGQRWELQRRLKRGGQAHVYLARDLWDDRWVVVKLFHRDTEVHARWGLEAERTLAVGEAGGHVPPLITSGIDPPTGDPYLVLALAENGSVGDWIAAAQEQGRYVPRAVALRVLRCVGDTLETARLLDYVHRDVKPSNVLLDAHGEAWVADWGIAQASPDPTITAGVVGSERYLAPERWRGERATHLTDVYAAAVMAYELLCGTVPFRGAQPTLMAAVLDEQPTPPTVRRRSLPHAVDSILLKGLAKDPAQRWASAQQMTDALVAALHAWAAADDAEDCTPPRPIDLQAESDHTFTLPTRLLRTRVIDSGRVGRTRPRTTTTSSRSSSTRRSPQSCSCSS